MAINTVVEGNKYSTTTLDSTVFELIKYRSPILSMIPQESLLGNSLTYDVITTEATVNFYNPGDTWVENTPVLTQYTVVLRILGGDCDLDNFIVTTRSNQINLQATALNNKAKVIRDTWLDTFYYGKNSTSPKEFDGMHTLMTSTTYNTVHAGATGSGTGTALSINRLRMAIDLMRTDNPKIMVMSPGMLRSLTTYWDSVGDKLSQGPNMFGGLVPHFDSIPIYVDDHIVDTETAASDAYTAKTGGANTSIFILTFGPEAVSGVMAGTAPTVYPIGELETKDATRYRIKWYTAVKFEDIRTAAKVDGIIAAGTVTA